MLLSASYAVYNNFLAVLIVIFKTLFKQWSKINCFFVDNDSLMTKLLQT